ncbi:SMP-30/gluconolactonase/LRE family protein [Saccharopolyspora sp. TS4A08]|uniref:SMP-30/gluconolactonase/LRE family protein n=1 Tax=Saccharopolyspora ipomoeae TaxID=3042027 RepID=A0ABT6PU41_9PSEU|nr:SMP-30/gluconolactonase/LRE family protein [Saccharopolyspora sp. TS4A08]MDI2031380.1 SMP-30/gluconolactonase/LRE family protein [Saccharopolyspora sp. TS4A08]
MAVGPAVGSRMRLVASGLEFPEGPIALSDGSVLLVEIRGQRLSRVSPDGRVSVVAELGGGPNGAAIGPDGAVYVCNNGGFEWHDREGITAPGHQPADYIGGRIQRVSVDGDVTDLYTECDGRPLRGPNDLVFDERGGFWFTDLGKSRERDSDTGALYYAQPDGSSITEVVHPLVQPNGVGLSPDGTRLYVAETGPGRVWFWDLAGPGRVDGRAQLLHGFSGLQMLDSLAVDGDGNVCVATLVTGAVSAIAPDGTLLRQVAVPEPDPFVTNICFAGADSRTAFVTSSGRGLLYAVEWDSPGLDLEFSA